MASTFSFPILPRREIASVLFEYQIVDIREEQLVNPTSDLVISVYSNILIYLDPLQEDHRQADFNALGQLENPDLHVDSVGLMNLCRKINELVGSVSCPTEFIMRDLIRPDTHRNGCFLSAILNFCMHREAKLALLQPLVDQVNAPEEQRSELEPRISELNMEIANLNEANEREQPFVAEVDGKVKELRQTIQELNNHQMLVKTSLLTVKNQANEIDEKISSAEFTLIQNAQENAKLRSSIVQSPDKLQGALEEKKSIRADVKNSERTAMQSFEEKSCTLDVYSKALKKMSKQLSQMHSTKEQADAAKKVEKDVKVLKAKQNDERLSGMSLEAKLVERQGKVEQLEELKRVYEKEKDMKHEEVAKNLDSLKLELESKKCDLAAREVKVKALVAQGDSINMRNNSEIESGAATKHQLYNKCEEIANEFHSYSHSVGSYIEGMQCQHALRS